MISTRTFLKINATCCAVLWRSESALDSLQRTLQSTPVPAHSRGSPISWLAFPIWKTAKLARQIDAHSRNYATKHQRKDAKARRRQGEEDFSRLCATRFR